MNKLIAIGLACCLPIGLAAEESAQSEIYLGTTNVLVLDDAPLAKDVQCSHAAAAPNSDCMAFNRALLTARLQRVSTLRERGRWM